MPEHKRGSARAHRGEKRAKLIGRDQERPLLRTDAAVQSIIARLSLDRMRLGLIPLGAVLAGTYVPARGILAPSLEAGHPGT